MQEPIPATTGQKPGYTLTGHQSVAGKTQQPQVENL